jgi:cyclin H
MLSKEPPERTKHWSNVIASSQPSCAQEPWLTAVKKAVYKAQIQPIRKKLVKCRDPDRSNLVELQRVHREQAEDHSNSDDNVDNQVKSLGKVVAVFGEALPRDSKRRKVTIPEDPCGLPF